MEEFEEGEISDEDQSQSAGLNRDIPMLQERASLDEVVHLHRKAPYVHRDERDGRGWERGREDENYHAFERNKWEEDRGWRRDSLLYSSSPGKTKSYAPSALYNMAWAQAVKEGSPKAGLSRSNSRPGDAHSEVSEHGESGIEQAGDMRGSNWLSGRSKTVVLHGRDSDRVGENAASGLLRGSSIEESAADRLEFGKGRENKGTSDQKEHAGANGSLQGQLLNGTVNGDVVLQEGAPVQDLEEGELEEGEIELADPSSKESPSRHLEETEQPSEDRHDLRGGLGVVRPRDTGRGFDRSESGYHSRERTVRHLDYPKQQMRWERDRLRPSKEAELSQERLPRENLDEKKTTFDRKDTVSMVAKLVKNATVRDAQRTFSAVCKRLCKALKLLDELSSPQEDRSADGTSGRLAPDVSGLARQAFAGIRSVFTIWNTASGREQERDKELFPRLLDIANGLGPKLFRKETRELEGMRQTVAKASRNSQYQVLDARAADTSKNCLPRNSKHEESPGKSTSATTQVENYITRLSTDTESTAETRSDEFADAKQAADAAAIAAAAIAYAQSSAAARGFTHMDIRSRSPGSQLPGAQMPPWPWPAGGRQPSPARPTLNGVSSTSSRPLLPFPAYRPWTEPERPVFRGGTAPVGPACQVETVPYTFPNIEDEWEEMSPPGKSSYLSSAAMSRTHTLEPRAADSWRPRFDPPRTAASFGMISSTEFTGDRLPSPTPPDEAEKAGAIKEKSVPASFDNEKLQLLDQFQHATQPMMRLPVPSDPVPVPCTLGIPASAGQSRNLIVDSLPTSVQQGVWNEQRTQSAMLPPTTLPLMSLPPTSLPPRSLPPTSLPPTSLPLMSLPPRSLPPMSLPSTSLPPITGNVGNAGNAGSPELAVYQPAYSSGATLKTSLSPPVNYERVPLAVDLNAQPDNRGMRSNGGARKQQHMDMSRWETGDVKRQRIDAADPSPVGSTGVTGTKTAGAWLEDRLGTPIQYGGPVDMEVDDEALGQAVARLKQQEVLQSVDKETVGALSSDAPETGEEIEYSSDDLDDEMRKSPVKPAVEVDDFGVPSTTSSPLDNGTAIDGGGTESKENGNDVELNSAKVVESQVEKARKAVSVSRKQRGPSLWGASQVHPELEQILEGLDETGRTALQEERERRMEEQDRMFSAGKLCLVLDLDHTLLNSAKFSEIEPEWEHRLRLSETAEKNRVGNGRRELYRFAHMGMWTKLRPGIWKFLARASELFHLHVYTMGNKVYATEMAKLLDPTGALFGNRVISKGDETDVMDGDEKLPKSKDLDGVMGMESAVVIIDDSVRVWPHHTQNLVVVERYMFFPCSRRQFGVPGPSLLEVGHDERETDGMLASALGVIDKVHSAFFSHQRLREVDVRTILASEQRSVLSGCRIVFSRVFPVGEAQPQCHYLWRMAEQFGAVCTTQIDDEVTHVVAISLGTDKVNWALATGRHVVRPAWIEASAVLYRRANERDFGLSA